MLGQKFRLEMLHQKVIKYNICSTFNIVKNNYEGIWVCSDYGIAFAGKGDGILVMTLLELL